jgi:hypothetical protein
LARASIFPGQTLIKKTYLSFAASADGAHYAFPSQFPPQQLDRFGLDQYIMVEIFDLVALGARVAVDALVLAAAIQVHAVIEPEPIVGPFNTYEQSFGLDLFDHGCIKEDLPEINGDEQDQKFLG